MQYTQSSEVLAYLGDAAYELAVRRACLDAGIIDLAVLNRVVTAQVRATAQSAAVERILPHLTTEEEELYRRGRNRHRVAAPKSASAVEYRRATGLETLFGALSLTGQDARFVELFSLCCPQEMLLLAASQAGKAI